MSKYPIVVIEGFPGISKRVVYSYRGHKIARTYRNHDIRNKTNNGYWYEVIFNDGTSKHQITTLSAAKNVIDNEML